MRHPVGSRPTAAQQIMTLWSVFLLGLLFHTQLALMPLFHGLAVVAPHGHLATEVSEIEPILWLMLGFFLIPLIAMIGTCWGESRSYRVGHFGLTVVYSVLNLGHLLADLLISPVAWYQVVLMAFLLGVGLLLNGAAYRWMQESRSPAPWRRPSPDPMA